MPRAFQSVDEVKAALLEEAERFCMTIDRFLMPDNVEKSELFQDAIEWMLSRKEKGDASDA